MNGLEVGLLIWGVIASMLAVTFLVSLNNAWGREETLRRRVGNDNDFAVLKALREHLLHLSGHKCPPCRKCDDDDDSDF